MTSADWSPSHSVPHLMRIDLFCLDFRSAFRLSNFSLRRWLCFLFCFLCVCTSHKKEKATQPGPRQQAKVDTNVIETGYWYSQSWLPCHLVGELFLLCIQSTEVFLLIVGGSVHSCVFVGAWEMLRSLVVSYFHAFPFQSWWVHYISVKVTSQYSQLQLYFWSSSLV